MRKRIRKRPIAEINVVPYIDVMLVLLIIFMITAPLLSQGIKVDLPQSASEPLPPTEKEPVVVSVDSEGSFYINYGENQDTPLEAQTLINRVSALLKYQPGIPVFIKGDRNVSYGRIVAVMSLLQQSGVENIGMVTEPPEN
jgi:biopolymer transport protein TolR